MLRYYGAVRDCGGSGGDEERRTARFTFVLVPLASCHPPSTPSHSAILPWWAIGYIMAAAVDSRQAIVDGLIDAAAREDILFVLYYLDKMGTHAAKATACIRTYYLHV